MNYLGSFEAGTRDAHSQSPAILVVAGARRFRAFPTLSAERTYYPRPIGPSVRQSGSPAVRQSGSPAVRQSVSPSVRQSVSPSVRQSVSPRTHRRRVYLRPVSGLGPRSSVLGPRSSNLSLHTNHLPQFMHNIHQLRLRRHHRFDRFIRHRRFIDDRSIFATLNALGGRDMIFNGKASFGFAA
jgi:hypothetical protein